LGRRYVKMKLYFCIGAKLLRKEGLKVHPATFGCTEGPNGTAKLFLRSYAPI
jgi:hypothetical protein